MTEKARVKAPIEGPDILLDGAHLLTGSGTGFASYGRTLAATLESMGCGLWILYGQSMRGAGRYPDLVAAGQVFANQSTASTERRLHERLLWSASILVGNWLRLNPRAKAFEINPHGIDFSTIESPQPHARTILNAHRLFDLSWARLRLNGRLTDVTLPRKPSVVHWTSPVSTKIEGLSNIYTLHDVIPLTHPHLLAEHTGAYAKLHLAVARRADLIITVSEFSKREIVRLLGVPEERVSVTYQVAPEPLKVPQEEAEKLVQKIYRVEPGNYAVFLGAIEPKKNLKRLIESFLLADLEIPLLLIGPLGWLYQEEMDLIDRIDAGARSSSPANDHKTPPPTGRGSLGSPIRYLGFLPRRHVTALLQCARFFTFPSICEGFGLPILEAMQLGVPVLTSNTSSLPEIAGDATVMIDPMNASDMTAGIRQLALDADLRRELSRRGPAQAAKFNTETYRKNLRAAYGKIGIQLPNHEEGPSTPSDLAGC